MGYPLFCANGNQEGDGVYLRPQNNTTRAQLAKMLSVFSVEYMKLGAVDKVEFLTDSYSVPFTAAPADPYRDVVNYLRLNGIVNGADELDYIVVDSFEQWDLRFGIPLDMDSIECSEPGMAGMEMRDCLSE